MPAVFVHGVPETPAMYRYADWLAAELAGLDDVDLVTHDWGALLMLKGLADEPGLVRSWATDAGDLGADFKWHDLALLWMTPGAGEEFMDGMVNGPVADRAALLAGAGVPEPGATEMAEALDATMAAAILTLYRSSADIGNEWGPGIDAIEGPGLVFESMQDPCRQMLLTPCTHGVPSAKSPQRSARTRQVSARLHSMPDGQ